MRAYDPVNFPVAAGERVWVADNVTGTVRSLDARTGEEQWRFQPAGPVRVAPSLHNGRLYFGSDDGLAYCLDAASGKELWSYDVVPDDRFVINNQSLISRYPIRTGVTVAGGSAYFGASLAPWLPSYLVALDAETGDVQYRRDLGTGYTLEASFALSENWIVAPQGRVAPLRFDRATGEPRGSFEGGGGSFCLVTEDDRVLHGPGNKKGWITDSGIEGQKLASFERGNAIVALEGSLFLLTDDSLGKLDRASGRVLWNVAMSDTLTMVGVGSHLVLGGKGRVEARRAEDGTLVWSHELLGDVHGLAVSAGRLLAATDRGELHAFHVDGEAMALGGEGSEETSSFEPAPVKRVSSASLVDRWVFQAGTLGLEGFENQVRGRPAARADGRLELIQAGEYQALKVGGGGGDLALAANLEAADLPKKAMTAMAWVRLDAPSEWGGILGALQDNGSYEKGWLLGFRKDRLGVCLNGVGGEDRLLWLLAPESVALGSWHHVAATYDSKRLALYVDGEMVIDSEVESGAIDYPPNARYHAGAYLDDDEYYRMTGALHELRLYSKALSARDIAKSAGEKSFPAAEPILDPFGPVLAEESSVLLERGPELRFEDSTTATVRWWGPRGQLEWWRFDGLEGELNPERHPDGGWFVRWEDLDRGQVYRFAIAVRSVRSQTFECDTHLTFHRPSHLPTQAPTDWAQGMGTLVQRGHVLVLGGDSERVAWLRSQLPRASFTVVATEAEAERLPPDFANLVLVETEGPGASHGARCVRPHGGALLVAPELSSAAFSGFMPPAVAQDSGPLDGYRHYVRTGGLEGEGDWSHMYGTPAAAAYGGEDLAGARTIQDLELRWIGRPGPRYQTDRQNRKPAPLCVAGRLYIQGLRRLICLDAYNGAVQWSQELPELMRFNIPRSAGNACADRETLYLAVRDRLHLIDAESGETREVWNVEDEGSEWGYVACTDDLLFGSAVRRGGQHTNWWSSAAWFDDKEGDGAAKVVSDAIFARDKATGEELWRYSVGRILDCTIVQADGRLFFCEARDATTAGIDRGRVHEPSLWTDLHLVCLDAHTGKRIWQRPAKPMAGYTAFYMIHGEGRLVLSSSDAGSFAVYVMADTDGASLWRQKFAWETDHHGKHISRPAIVGGELILRPAVFHLETGEAIDRPFPEGHQCGSYAASTHALFLRAGDLCMWDREEGGGTRWARVRPDCWLSTIPAGGMLLSPEGGGGCSCGSWMESSMGFAPKRESLR